MSTVTTSFLMSFATTATGKTKDRYTLDQILTIMLLKDKKVKAEAIGAAVGHPTNSITYKCMWISKQVAKHGDNVLPELYKAFNVALPEGDIVADVQARVEKFLAGDQEEVAEEANDEEEQAS